MYQLNMKSRLVHPVTLSLLLLGFLLAVVTLGATPLSAHAASWAGPTSHTVSTGPSKPNCDAPVNAKIVGGQASWIKCYYAGGVRVDGWVRDTLPDFKCAYVHAEFNNGHNQEKESCSGRKNFHFNEKGATSVQVYLGKR